MLLRLRLPRDSVGTAAADLPDGADLPLGLFKKALEKECIVRTGIIEIVGRSAVESAGHGGSSEKEWKEAFGRFIMTVPHPAVGTRAVDNGRSFSTGSTSLIPIVRPLADQGFRAGRRQIHPQEM
ncbi:MAG: hypothetical protein EGQ34_03410 [Sutterella sp.]|nr:hypothetical protein [Sutterella sp.]